MTKYVLSVLFVFFLLVGVGYAASSIMNVKVRILSVSEEVFNEYMVTMEEGVLFEGTRINTINYE